MSAPKENVMLKNYLFGGFGVPWFMLPANVQNNEKFRQYLEDLTFCNYLNDFTNKRISSFKYKGLPVSCDSWTIEILYFFYGNVGMYRNPETGEYLCCGLTPYGKNGVNPNGRPTDGWLYMLNGKTKEVKLYFDGIDEPITRETSTRKFIDATYDCVRGQENSLGIPYFQNVLEKCIKLSKRESILDSTIENCRQPIIIKCDERDLKNVKAKFDAFYQGKTNIVELTNGGGFTNSIEIIDLNVKPELINIIKDEVIRLQNETNQMLGFNTTPYEKKERLVVDEVNSNNEITDGNIELALKWRQKFCEDCNKAFGLNMSVEYAFNDKEVIEDGKDKLFEMEAE